MIRTNHPAILVATLVVLVVAVIALDPGLAALFGPGGEAAPEPPAVEDRDLRTVTTSNLTDEEGRVLAERRYEGTPERIEEKARNHSRAREIRDPSGFVNADSVNISRYVGEKVVLVEFWTFGCYNCQNTHPHVQDYWRSYEDEGLVVIGVHYPEFAYEAERDNVEAYVDETNTTYPVVLDNDGGTWDAYDQRFWPTRYLIGVDGFVRYEHIGEGGYEETDRRIRELLAERDRVRNATDDPADA